MIELFEEEDAILEPTFPITARYVHWNKNSTMLLGQIQNVAG